MKNKKTKKREFMQEIEKPEKRENDRIERQRKKEKKKENMTTKYEIFSEKVPSSFVSFFFSFKKRPPKE